MAAGQAQSLAITDVVVALVHRARVDRLQVEPAPGSVIAMPANSVPLAMRVWSHSISISSVIHAWRNGVGHIS